MKTVWALIYTIVLPMVAIAQNTTSFHSLEVNRRNTISAAGLTTLKSLAEAADPTLLGFQDRQELEKATVGTAIEEYIVPLNSLKEYDPDSDDPRSLLEYTGRVTLPILVDGKGRSAITFEQKDGAWTPVSFGGANYSAYMTSLRSTLAATENQSESSYFEVRVRALNVVLIGYVLGEQLFLASLLDDARFGLQRGEMMPARDMIARFLAAAKAHNGLPT